MPYIAGCVHFRHSIASFSESIILITYDAPCIAGDVLLVIQHLRKVFLSYIMLIVWQYYFFRWSFVVKKHFNETWFRLLQNV